jgi:DNA mismatch repair protein MutS2
MISENTIRTLEFDKILKLIANYAKSEISKKNILSIKPLDDHELIIERQKQTNEIQKLINEGDKLLISPFNDITPLLTKLKPEDSFLEGSELLEFVNFFEILTVVSEQIRKRNDLPYLKEIISGLTGFKEIAKTIKKSIDNEGNVNDNASPKLLYLRNHTKSLETKILSKLEEIVRDEKVANFLQDNFITIRSGRWVIPVRMDSKGLVPGVVHDVSKSGDTAFIEPLSIINMANELENLKAEQKAEEIRILKSLCSLIRPLTYDISREFNTLVYLDIINSIAEFSNTLRMNIPFITKSMEINLIDGRHPLLELTLQSISPKREIIPLTLYLGRENNVMVITGANAGGKTIALKTIGLLILMALSGMPVPASPNSVFPFIANILTDIGDEQSIEHNLSTFSAHISKIVEITKSIDNNSIVLIDEVGTGTDPEEGSALACAILKELQKSNALIFATTHLSEIKAFVYRSRGMINASMEFDHKTLTPLYKLRIGEPGQSHAIEIARKYGLPENILQLARDMIGKLKSELDEMIADLNKKRALYEELLLDIKEKQVYLEIKEKQLSDRLKETEKEYKKIISSAWEEAYRITSNIKREANIIIEELKKKGISEKKVIISRIDTLQGQIEEKIKEYNVNDTPVLKIDDIKKGNKVFVKSINQYATVIDINTKSNRVKVSTKGFEIEVSINDITKKSEEDIIKNEFDTNIDIPVNLNNGKLNVIGLHIDDAISKLEEFLNHASITYLSEIVIIHGIGKGSLMKAIHEHLKSHPLVKSFKSGNIEQGGRSVTIVTLI